MGAPALDPAAGCLPAAVFPGFFQREFLSLAGAFALAARPRCPLLPSGACSPALVQRPCRGPQGPAAPLPCGDGQLPRLFSSTAAAAVAGRRLLLLSSLPGFAGSAANTLSTDVACLRRPLCLAEGRVACLRRLVLCCSSLGFFIKPSIPPRALFCRSVCSWG